MLPTGPFSHSSGSPNFLCILYLASHPEKEPQDNPHWIFFFWIDSPILNKIPFVLLHSSTVILEEEFEFLLTQSISAPLGTCPANWTRLKPWSHMAGFPRGQNVELVKVLWIPTAVPPHAGDPRAQLLTWARRWKSRWKRLVKLGHVRPAFRLRRRPCGDS